MTVQEKMKAYRQAHGYSVDDMSFKSGASAVLLRMIERGNVTHPKIAEQIGKAYKLDKEDIYRLMPPNYRPGKDYDPDKYVIHVPESRNTIAKRMNAEGEEWPDED